MPRFLFLLAAFIPGLAFADVSFIPMDSDITVKYFLNSIFGSLVNIGSGSDPMSGVISELNKAILLVGGVLLAYGLVAGTMQTAHDGEVLGKRWSSMWVPIRTSLGISAIVPLGSGYAAIQYVMMWLVLQGVGAANIVWNAYASSADPLAEVAIMQSNGKGAEIADIVLQQQLCTVVINGEVNRAKAEAAARGETNYMVEPYGQIQVDPLGNPTGATTANSFEKNACGGFDLPAANLAANPLLQSWFGQTFDQNRFSGTMTSAHTSAFNNLSSDMYNLALKIYGGAFASPQTAPALAQQFKTATDKYNKAIGDAARSAMGGTSQTNDVARHAATDGWGMAGAWYMKYVYVQNAINQEVSRYPTVTPPNMEAVPTEFKGALAEFVSRYNAIRKYTSYTNELGVETMLRDDYRANNPLKSAMGSTQGSEDSSKFSKYLNEKYGSVLTAPNRYLGQSMVGNKNPVLAAKDFGDYVFTTSTTATLAMATIAAFLPTSSMVVASPLIFTLTGALMGFSSILAFYLPIAPYIIWFGVLIGWLVMVVEAVIAAPLWAVAHVHPDGDGIVGRAGQGYSLILGLMLRPALAVVGLVAAMTLIIPVGQLFNRTYWAVFDMSQGNSVQGLFTFAACISIFSVTYLAIINRMFALIHVIPDQILRWMGGPSSDLGSYAGDLGGASSKNAAVVGGVAGGLGSSAMQSAQQKRQLDETRKGKEAQERANEMQQRRATASQMDQRQATNDSFESLGMPEEGKGIVAAQMAGETKRDEALATAQKALKEDKGSEGKAFRLAEKQGDATHMNNALWNKVKEQNGGVRGSDGRINGGTNPSEIAAIERERAYSEWRKQPSRQENGNIAGSYSEAMSKYQAAKVAAENGQKYSQSAPPVQPTTKPDGDSGDVIQ